MITPELNLVLDRFRTALNYKESVHALTLEQGSLNQSDPEQLKKYVQLEVAKGHLWKRFNMLMELGIYEWNVLQGKQESSGEC